MNLRFEMRDVLPLLPIPQPMYGRSSYNIPCPICDKPGSRNKHLNINLKKNVFCCPKCGSFSGGVFDIYAYYENIPRDKVYKHLKARLDGEDTNERSRGERRRQRRSPPPPPVPETELADIETRDQIYRALLDELPLEPDHRQNLLNRGLTNEAIDSLHYRSAPTTGFYKLTEKLISDGHNLNGVPGFYLDKHGRWTFALYKRGIMIPCRDSLGRIQSIHIRLDRKIKNRGKFLTFSSPDLPGGAGAETWCHLAGPPKDCVLLIEGYMKADIVHQFTGMTVLAIPGVASIHHLEATLKSLAIKHIMTCFDMDYLKNWHVEGSYTKLVELLGSMDLTFGTYLWDPACNGLDDYLFEYFIKKRSDRRQNE